MGVEYSYYDEKNHAYFEMGKWYCWDREQWNDLTAVDKLFLPKKELADLLDAYMIDFDMLKTERRDYANWLAEQLSAFAKTTTRNHVQWVNDSDDSDCVISTCRRCKTEYLCEGDACDCEPQAPDTARRFGTRYRGDDDEMLKDDEPVERKPRMLVVTDAPKVREGRLFFGHGFLAFEKTGSQTAIVFPQPQIEAGKTHFHQQHNKLLRVEIMPRVLGDFTATDTVDRIVVANHDQLLYSCSVSQFNFPNYMQGESLTLRPGEGIDLYVTLAQKTRALFYFRAWEICE